MSATLLVLAAGMGSRFGGIKQIEPVGAGGEAIIDFSVFDAARAGFTRVVFVVRRDIEADFRKFLHGRFTGIETDIVLQEMNDLPAGFTLPASRKKPWGTGHAILCAREVVQEPFAVINADDFYGRDAYRVLYNHLAQRTEARAEYAMVGYRLDRTLSRNGSVSRGICRVDSSQNLISVEEHTKIQLEGTNIVSLQSDGSRIGLSPGDISSMNLFGFTPAVYDQLERLFIAFLNAHINEPTAEFYIPVAVNELVRAHDATVAVLRSEAEWFGMTYREDVPDVKERIRELQAAGQYPARLYE
ncbi:MAG TPA: NTP transferase domain-containing protein [Spirochaetia bacterium]|nr:NTP transferase domain-containing protein [Spirochaetia bacterium]